MTEKSYIDKLGFFSRFVCAFSAFLLLWQSMTVFADTEDDERDFTVTVNSPPHIVFLGDSIAAGYGLDGYSAEDKSSCASYANLLTEIFDAALPEQSDFSSDNLAKDGLTSAELLENLTGGNYDDKLDNADAVVISIGGNDLLNPLWDVLDGDQEFKELIENLVGLESSLDESLDNFEQALSKIIAEVNVRSDSPEIFVQTLYNPFENYSISMLDELASDKIGRLNEIIESCSQNGESYTVCDVASAFEGENEVLTNIDDLDIHPNADGHARIAEVLLEKIQSKEYTYYDYEAEAEYITEKQNEETKQKELKERVFMILAAVSGGVIVVLAVVEIVSAKKKKQHYSKRH